MWHIGTRYPQACLPAPLLPCLPCSRKLSRRLHWRLIDSAATWKFSRRGPSHTYQLPLCPSVLCPSTAAPGGTQLNSNSSGGIKRTLRRLFVTVFPLRATEGNFSPVHCLLSYLDPHHSTRDRHILSPVQLDYSRTILHNIFPHGQIAQRSSPTARSIIVRISV